MLENNAANCREPLMFRENFSQISLLFLSILGHQARDKLSSHCASHTALSVLSDSLAARL